MNDNLKFYSSQLKPLGGGKIVGLINAGDGYYGLRIELKDGTHKGLILLSDDEGNAPGSFEIADV